MHTTWLYGRMKTIELNQIADTGKAFQAKAAAEFGANETAPSIIIATKQELFVAGLTGVGASERMPGSRIIPIAQNLARLSANPGRVFGVMRDKSLFPAVVTNRSTSDKLHLTYLAGVEDVLDPANPALTDTQKALLIKTKALQDPRLGTHAADGNGVGGEFGHQQLGMIGVLNPKLLSGAHPVHGWTESGGGIAGAVTNPTNGSLYDVTLRDGVREIREPSVILTEGVLIDHKAFHEVDTFELGATPQEFAAGLGVIALGSRLGSSNVEARAMEALKHL